MRFDFDALLANRSSAFVVAELSANHHRSYQIAADTIHAIRESGADAVKVQTYTPDTITLDSDKDYFKIKQGTIWDGRTLYELYQEAYMPWEWQPDLKRLAESIGLTFFSAPFDNTATDLLEGMGVAMYKIASFEITDIPLIEYVASKGKPVIISTGIATLTDIEEALSACKRVGNNRVALLKCTSEYPTPIAAANLRTIPNMRETFHTVVGLSDHTSGMVASICAVTLGAKIIEKHFILDRKIPSPDASFSMEPQEFAQMVRAIREAEEAIGRVSYDLSEKVKKSREHARSLFVTMDMKRGDAFTGDNLRSIRPGFGMHPRHLTEVLGRRARTDIARGTPLDWAMIE
jgi:pseudaminic acid synthase